MRWRAPPIPGIFRTVILNHPANLRGTVLAIRDGADGIYDTLRVMREFVETAKLDPNMRARVAQLLLMTPEKDQLREVVTIFEFARDRIRYMQDVAGVETVSSPQQTMAIGAGDCDDKAVLLATMLEIAGYPSKFIATGYSVPGVFEHVYVAAQLKDGAWIPLDATEKVPVGWEAPFAVTYYVER